MNQVTKSKEYESRVFENDFKPIPHISKMCVMNSLDNSPFVPTDENDLPQRNLQTHF